MQQNEFEKQVKDKLDEFNFQPSPPVWEAIKRHIEKKKRRILPFIFLLIAIVIAGGYFFYVDLNNTNQIHHYTTSIKKGENNKTSKTDSVKGNNSGSYVTSSQLNYQSTTIKKKQNNSDYTTGLDLKNYNGLHKKAFLNAQDINNNFVKVSKQETSFHRIIKKSTTAEKAIEDVNKQSVNFDSSSNNQLSLSNQHLQISESNIPAIKTDSIKSNNDKTLNKDSSLSNTKQTHIKSNKAQTWKWGITAMYGRSNVVNNFSFKSINSQAFDLSAVAADSIRNTNSSGKPYWSASAYNVGVVIQRKIFKQAHLNFGLQFLHLSTKSYTGLSSNNSLIPIYFSSNPGAANNYYVSGTRKTFINKYNFIELPVSFQDNLLRIKQFALLYNIGGSVMQQLSGKSLLYDSRNNTLFKDTSMLLRHTQFQLLSGIDVQLDTKNKGSFLIGPHVEYSLSGFLKNNDYDKMHYIHFDLKMSWLFNKY